MKQRLRYIIGLSLVTPLLVLAPVAIAHGEDSSSSNSSSTQASPPSGQTTDSSQTEQEKTQMEARLTKLKTDLKIKLGATELALIKAKCVPAQALVKSLSDKTFAAAPQRTTAYQELSSKLNTLLGKLQAKGVDTTELQQELTSLQAKITTYTTDLATYKQTLSDVRNVDCATDPTAFKAALLTARTDRDKVITDITAIKAYVTGTIKPTLQKIRTELASSDSNNSSQSQGGN